MTTTGLDLYEGLARYQWWLRRLRGQRPGQGLEMHKRLHPPAAGASGPGPGDAWHDWLWQRLQPPATPRVLDLGCGFGGSVLHFAQRHPGRYVGLGNSSFQLVRARAQAARLGLASRCDFRRHSHGEPIDGCFDAVLGVETLLHADDLARALRMVAACLAPGARLVSMEDVARVRSDHPAAVLLCQRWGLRGLWTGADWAAAARVAGLRTVEEHDLTAQVRLRPSAALARAELHLMRLRRVLPGRRSRAAVDAFLGGIELERLYAAGEMLYRCAVFVHEAAA